MTPAMTTEPTRAALAGEVLKELARYLITPLDLGGLGSRLNPASFIVFIIVGLVVYAARRRRGEDAADSPLGFIFPRSAYLSRSSLMDIKVYLASSFVVFDKVGTRILTTSAVAAWVSAGLIGVFGAPEPAPLTGWRWALCLLAAAAAYDFGGYWLHRMSHELPPLWAFHEVHHSAEGLTPLTVARIHPMHSFFGSLFIPLTVGPVLGVVYALFGEQDAVAITGVSMSYTIFNLAGANLRHSHIWLGYGPVLSRVFCSPAMHQIHHSVAPEHWNKNHAEIFSLWDWMFGTLYVPKARETLTFGVGRDAEGRVLQPHPTLKAALIHPFLKAWESIRAGVAARLNRPRSAEAAPVLADAP